MTNFYEKRILILANECLSTRTSNGRTLANFLIHYPKAKLAQFSLQSTAPDFDRCEQYFCISDQEALQAFLKGKRVGKFLQPEVQETASSAAQKGRSRTALTMLLRDLVWGSGRWKKGGFYDFVRAFAPEVILLQAGDCAFMLDLGRKLAKEYNIPLVIYNSEGYYFKKYDYFRASGLAHLCYPIFRRHFCKSFEKAMRKASHVIYNCSALQQDYAEHFSVPSTVLYTATQLSPQNNGDRTAQPRISYLGNLEVGRHESLITMANILGKLRPECKLDVYGKVPNEQVENELRACPHIRLCGFVSYEQVQEVMHNSDILVHAEGFDAFYTEDSKYAFSTKIADSLACGTCFLVYAPKEFACCRYLREHEAAYVVSAQEELEVALELLLNDPNARKRYLENAKTLVDKNHRAEENAAQFTQILNDAR